MLQKAVWVGSNHRSYPLAEAALRELAGVRLSAKQIRRMVNEIGQARLAERDQAVTELKQMPLPKRQAGSQASQPPQVAVISMDGGRYQRRDHFQVRGEPTRKAPGPHWRETKVGSLLSMESEVHAQDPAPDFPEWLAACEVVQELAKMVEETASGVPLSPADEDGLPRPREEGYQPPKLLSRDVVASSADAHEFGWQLETRAWQRGFPAAQRQAFVCDGLKANWSVWRRHFSRATPILDLMHALSYAWPAAQAVAESGAYRQWAEWIWKGEVAQVIQALRDHQQRLGPPSKDAPADDPRARIDRALTYYTNNQQRMKYPEYRRQGLPLTSSHIESTIKQINSRIKGSEKFWCRDSGDAVLQLRADYLTDRQPMTDFWRRWQASQTGSNSYRTAA